MKKKLLAVALTSVLGATGTALAAPINLQAGPVYFQFNNLEQIDTSLTNSIVAPGGGIDVNGDGTIDTPNTEGNWGVFNLSSIQYGGIATPHQDISGGSAYFADDGPGDLFGQGQVSGIFYGLTLNSTTQATGGWMDIYWEDAATDDITSGDMNGLGITPSVRTAANQAGIFTDGTLLARLEFASGITPGDTTTTLKSNIDVTNITGSGQSDAFANVIDINNDGVIDNADGTWAKSLNQDWFNVDDNGNGTFGEAGETRDLRFSTFFNLLASWNDPNNQAILGLRSNDPGRAFVPEPATLALIGTGLLGLGFGTRRRKS